MLLSPDPGSDANSDPNAGSNADFGPPCALDDDWPGETL